MDITLLYYIRPLTISLIRDKQHLKGTHFKWKTQIKEVFKTKEALRQIHQIYLSLCTLGALAVLSYE